MSGLVPPVGARGRYTVRDPFSVSDAKVYTCTAVRKFSDVEAYGIQLFDTYYEPMGLSLQALADDRLANARLITLESDSERPIYVPSTYITSFPNGNVRQYHRVVLATDLGMIPDHIDLTSVTNGIKNVVSDVTGVEPRVHTAIAPIQDYLDPTTADALEATRTGAIKTRTTEYARRLELQRTVDRLTAHVRLLENILRTNNLLP